MYTTVVAIHAGAMYSALVLLVLCEVALLLARDGRITPVNFALLASRVGGALMGLGLVAGIALVILGGWSLLTPWLLLAFALIAALVVVEGRLVRPWETRLRPALRSASAETALPTIVTDRRALAGRLTMIALFALIILTMRTKPDLDLPL